jgi:TIGR03009 family protein
MPGHILIPERIPITMNRRRFFQFCLAGAVSPCLLAFQPASLFAQGAPRAEKSGQQIVRGQRPVGQPLRVTPPSPAVMKILQDWEKASGKFKKLKGEFFRWRYVFVFNVEYRSKGNFWYEAPDKGRMDTKPWKSKDDPRTTDKNGKPLPGSEVFKVQPDKEDQWVINGKEIIKVNSADRTIVVVPIPKENQGEGITDSPLPFLFGMKAKKAAVRYQLSLGTPMRGRIHLIAKPNLIQDARNWSRAEIMLDAKTFYPQALKLIDPGGNGETVYQFSNVREPNFFEEKFGANPFVIKRAGFKRIVYQAPTPQANPKAIADKNAVKMPKLVGQHWKKVETLLNKHGYKRTWKQGVTAPRQELVNYVYRQSPQPGMPLKKSETIVLTVYLKPVARAAAKPAAGRN